MATSFTYKSRKQYLNPSVEADDLKDVTGSYVGPNQILINILPDGTWDTSRVPADDEDLDISSVDDIDQTAPEGGTWHILDKDNADDIILMDMMMDCRGHTNEWQTTTIKEITLSDGSTYTMQYRNPVNDNTRHTFDIEKTTVDQDTGKPNFVRFETWLEIEVQRERAEKLRLFYTEKMNNAISATTKANWKKMVEVYEHIESNLIDTVPNHKIEFPMPGVVLQGKTYTDG